MWRPFAVNDAALVSGLSCRTSGACFAMASISPFTMPALICATQDTAQLTKLSLTQPRTRCSRLVSQTIRRRAHVEEVVACHAGLSWYTGRDDHDIGTLQRIGELVFAHISLQWISVSCCESTAFR